MNFQLLHFCHWTLWEVSPVEIFSKECHFFVLLVASCTHFLVIILDLCYRNNLQLYQTCVKVILLYNISLHQKGISSLITITGMAIVRYLSVVRLQRCWHIHDTKICIWTSPCIWIIWTIGFVFAVPPLIGFGEYKLDTSRLWWVWHILLSDDYHFITWCDSLN